LNKSTFLNIFSKKSIKLFRISSLSKKRDVLMSSADWLAAFDIGRLWFNLILSSIWKIL